MAKRFFTVIDTYGTEAPRHFSNKMVAKAKRNTLNEHYETGPRYEMEYGPDHKRNLKEQSDEKSSS